MKHLLIFFFFFVNSLIYSQFNEIKLLQKNLISDEITGSNLALVYKEASVIYFNIQKILEFLGLEYDKNVKNYRKTALKRAKINTPSSSQVVQPLYKTSINKWKNYEKYCEDCHQYLEKWVSYFDY